MRRGRPSNWRREGCRPLARHSLDWSWPRLKCAAIARDMQRAGQRVQITHSTGALRIAVYVDTLKCKFSYKGLVIVLEQKMKK